MKSLDDTNSLHYTNFTDFLYFFLNNSGNRSATARHRILLLTRDIDIDVWSLVLRTATFAVCITAIVLNILSVLAITLSRGMMSANLRLICSLSLSDILCGLCAILDHWTVTSFDSCEGLVIKCMLITAHLIGLLTLLGLAVDHYLAICRPLYHRTDVNISRVNITIVVIWIASLFCSSLDIILPVNTSIISKHILCKNVYLCL